MCLPPSPSVHRMDPHLCIPPPRPPSSMLLRRWRRRSRSTVAMATRRRSARGRRLRHGSHRSGGLKNDEVSKYLNGLSFYLQRFSYQKMSMDKPPYTMRPPRKPTPEYYLNQVLPILLQRRLSIAFFLGYLIKFYISIMLCILIIYTIV